MDKMMSNPWFLRIIALVLAISLFISVKNEMENTNGNKSSTQIDTLREVPVEVYYDDDNLIVTGAPETVTVNIEGPSTLVFSARAMKDYKVFIDLRKLTIGTHRVEISHENFSEKLNVRIDPRYATIVIEERITVEKEIDPDMNEGLLAENYVVKSYELEPRTVTITGAKSVVDSISYVKATINGEKGISKSFEQEASIRVLDRDLNKLNVTIEPKTVQVKVNVEEYSKEVPVVLSAKGIPKEGVVINKLSTTVEKIRLFGPRIILDKMEQLNVEVDVSKLEQSGEFETKLVLPEGVTKMSLDKLKVIGDVTPAPIEEPDIDEESVSGLSTKTFDQISVEVRNLPEQLISEFETSTDGIVTVIAKGTPEALDKIKTSDIALYVDANDATIGEKTFPIKMNVITDVELEMSKSEVKLTIKEA
ncbi:CdaR family protein [Psychrobacillus sp.]|uniref:CdaR family protein n=1 Tax=Psychrobacillus sp. TaxID=1871623 RepID=UPI0028BD2989|nr:CdaR family protein [Psychrobacillus sp.]